ncbi:GntR family transcriptional regulator [Kaistia dalseonensis]|uniref:DNA-binding GntR family transcriptional regulator n=1 Tax=Kaistia dalseonensis TaxID=410840 RepID=A0ABU0H712_9HYPH|nr:GntR family transcriptional regulator [Kaistia dalseonensis]MCX5495505.1 GntR family transcriptional regulator [Kaistia dalseonensis]MDQ0438097.1 DNA-binding GntR family transcriptional regulator [Kaistia dalseonensis]
MAIALSDPKRSKAPGLSGGADPFPPGAEIDRSRPIGEQVYLLLRHAITNWRLRPGDVIPEALVTKRFDVSRSPLREAVRQLAADGLVVIRPQAGTYVSSIDRVRWEEGRLIRRALEIEGIRLAASRIEARHIDEIDMLMTQQRRAVEARDFERLLDLDDRFHAYICDLSGFPRLWRMIDGAKAQIDRTRYMALPAMGRADATLTEHQAIFDALVARDPDASVDRLLRHLDSSDQSMAQLFDRDDFDV